MQGTKAGTNDDEHMSGLCTPSEAQRAHDKDAVDNDQGRGVFDLLLTLDWD